MIPFASIFSGLVSNLPEFLLRLPVILLALTVHETAHGYVAYKLGDPTAKMQGRLTLNPLKHLDPMGALMMLLFRFGWAKPVPIDPRYFKHPKRDMALVAAAGPVSNLLLGFLGLFCYRAFYAILKAAGVLLPAGNTLFFAFDNPFLANLINYTALFFSVFFLMNVSLAVFNLIPIPPMDGSRILFQFLPERYYWRVMQYERYIMLGLMLALWTGILTRPLSILTSWVIRLMDFLVSLLPFL